MRQDGELNFYTYNFFVRARIKWMYHIISDPSLGVGSEPVPDRSKQDLLPGWCACAFGRGERLETHRHPHHVPSACSRLHFAQVCTRKNSHVPTTCQYVHGSNSVLKTLPEASTAVERHSYHPAQLCRLLEAAQLAVVAPLHKSQAPPAGDEHGGQD